MTETNYTITDEADWNDDILAVNVASHGPTPLSFTFTIDPAAGTTITLDQTLEAVNLGAASTLDIVGDGSTLNGANSLCWPRCRCRCGLRSPNLTIENVVAQGGDGTGAGGGGAGLGGGLFIGGAVSGDPGAVTLSDVTFLNDSAIGGNGGYSAGGVASAPAAPPEPAAGTAGFVIGRRQRQQWNCWNGWRTGQPGGGGGNGGRRLRRNRRRRRRRRRRC